MNDDENDDRFLVRQALTQKDVDVIYASGYASLFTIKLHHGGKFTRFPDRRYVDGKIDHIDMIDIDKFCVHDLDHVMLRLGYNEDEPIYYHFLVPENLSSWTWFLECLGEDLDLDVRSNFTFVSDRQKGLLPAMANVFPSAEHRYCLRHIHENFKGTFKGKEYKDMLWKAATSTTVVHFKRAMDVLKEFNTDAHEWLSKIPPEHWSRSHFSGRALSDVLLNNMCEVFNGKISEGRDKPIYSALEFIREYLMRRIVTALKTIEKSEGLLTPTTTKLFEKIKNEAAGYTATWNGGELYQVTWNGGSNSDQVVVNLEDKTCACRRWELTGIPCKHAVAAIWIKSRNSEEVGYLESWVNPVYSMERWKQVYSFRINPINGRGMWDKTDVATTLSPPTHHTPVGRPKKARKRSAVEMEDLNSCGRISKKNSIMTCSKCGNKGHNQRTCKGQGGSSTVHEGNGRAATIQQPTLKKHKQSMGQQSQGSQRMPKKNTCGKCGGKGHNARTCKA
ncbi:hypothetical protein SSX86_018460 [Deinandra increscens subsp. villosa]|uniref:SWIM-type domain-containing protein n=1 Tax=Deinandra increscens subsp. villosa TaxID=3103831 RepID=A0AAP0CVJ7_9ASTR